MAGEGLKISSVQSTDEGVYVCHADNSAGSREAHAKLTVLSACFDVILSLIINSAVAEQSRDA